MIFRLFSKARRPDVALKLLERVSLASRVPALYAEAGIPDTFEGRFESLTLHAFLVMRRLGQLPAPAADVAQEFVDHLFAHLDQGLRQSGIGDLGVPKRMKKLAQGFYGRLDAYAEAVDDPGSSALEAALRRNVTGGGDAAALAGYVVARMDELADASLDHLVNGEPLMRPFAGMRNVS